VDRITIRRVTRWLPRRFGLRTAFVLLTLAALASWYGRSYYLISRRGMEQARFANSIHEPDESLWRDNWMYVTHDEIQHDLDTNTFGNHARNRRRYWFYRPAALVDEYLLGGPPAWVPRPLPGG
jgi:hypothetical protein